MPYELNFLIALGVSIATEFIVITALIKYFYRQASVNSAKLIAAGVLPTMATLPYVWFVLPYFMSNTAYIIVSEAFAFIIESLIISLILNIKLKQGVLLSFCANLTSVLLGLLLWNP